jgi:hypothetical protein
MGILLGTTLFPVISTTKRHKLIMWGFRLAAIPLAIILYVVLVRNFYTANPYAGEFPNTPHLSTFSWSLSVACSGCRYLSCIPRSGNNYCKGYVCRSFLYLCASSCFSGSIERESPLPMADPPYRGLVYLDYCLLNSDMQRQCTIPYSRLSFIMLV